MITRRNALWLIPLLLILSFPLWKIPVASFLTPRGGFDTEQSNGTRDKHNFSMNGVTIQQSDKGRKTATIRARQAHSSKVPDQYILREVNADIFDEKGNLTNILADTGNYNTQKKYLKLIDDVVITNTTDNYTMKTDLLYYDGEKRTVFCPGATQLKGDGIVIDGTSFGHDIDSGVYTVGGRVLCLLQGYKSS
jgi:LPS export ABC transporter protein LptC